MFIIKKSMETAYDEVNVVELMINGASRLISSHKELEKVLHAFEVEDISVKFRGVFYPAWNIYSKINDRYLVEGKEVTA